MNNSNTFYKKNKQRFQEQGQTHFHQRGGEEEQKNIIKITKKGCRNNRNINIENYLMERKIKRENVEEKDAEICLRKTNEN